LEPEDQEARLKIVEELEAVLQTPAFANSKRYPAFLRFAVETVLAGRAEELKERTLGIEVFHRPPDYDTNSDTVVRFTAGEVRKRLTAFYREAENERSLQIVLPTGSYVPEFYTSDAEEDAHLTNAPLHTRQTSLVSAEHLPNEATKRRPVAKQTLLTLVAAGVGMAALVVAGLWLAKPVGLNAFWNGLGPASAPILFTPGTVMLAGDPPSLVTADSTHKMVFMSTETASTLTSLATRFGKDGHAYQVLPVANTTLSDLRSHPAVLVGAYNNDWTMRLTVGLPFHFGPVDHRGIFSSGNPAGAWISDLGPDGKRTSDYAIVARYRDNLTENMVVVLAGLNKRGTEAASEFVTEGRYFDAARSQLPAGWEKKNVEFVLRTDLVGNTSSAPRVVALKVW
jgi:hypothetical protein